MEPGMRAADADRDRVVALLREQVGAGRLTLGEFSDRAATAYEARGLGELDALTRDIPVDPPARETVPSSATSHSLLVPALVVLAFLIVGALLVAGAAGAMMTHMGGM